METVRAESDTVRAEPFDFAQDRLVEAYRASFEELSANAGLDARDGLFLVSTPKGWASPSQSPGGRA
jgi:hypothetical protein